MTPAEIIALLDMGITLTETAQRLWANAQKDATPEEQAKWRATFEANRSKVGLPPLAQ